MRCIWYDDLSYKQGDSWSYEEATKNGIIIFKEGMIRDATIKEPLKTNFGRSAMKKIMDARLGKNNSLHGN